MTGVAGPPHGRTELGRPCDDGHGRRVHRRDHGWLFPRVRDSRRPGAVEGAPAASARATPLIFTTEDDAVGGARQMVAIAAGGHDVPGEPMETKLVVFSLRPETR